jgi:hypothetical protein
LALMAHKLIGEAIAFAKLITPMAPPEVAALSK